MLGLRLLGAPFDTKVALVVRPANRQAPGLHSAAVATGGGKWLGFAALGASLHGAAYNAERVLAAHPSRERTWGLDSSGVAAGDAKWLGVAEMEV